MIEETSVLGVLDSCAQSFSFPMLDNGYIYPASARLSVFGDREDWAIVIETFGYSPRAHVPTLNVETFASRLHNRHGAAAYYPDSGAYETHVRANPHNESMFFTPLEDGPWIDIEHVAAQATDVTFRGERTRLPALSDYEALGIARQDPRRVAIFELCRALATTRRRDVLGTNEERRTNVPPELPELLVLDDWHHPDLVVGELPSDTETFRALAAVAAHGDPARYVTSETGNTHWTNWPDGGRL